MALSGLTSILKSQKIGKLTGNPTERMRAGLIKVFEESSPILNLFPVQDVGTRTYSYMVESSVGSVNVRAINEAPVLTNTGDYSEHTETLKLYYANFKMDRAFDRNPGLAQQIRVHDQMSAMRAMSYEVLDDIFNANAVVDPRRVHGLRYRVAPQMLFSADMNNPGVNGPLSLRTLDRLIHTGRGINAIVVGVPLFERLTEALRTTNFGGAFQFAQEEKFGLDVITYKGIKIYAAKEGKGGTRMLEFTEDGFTIGAGNTASLYCFNTNPDSISILQNSPMKLYTDKVDNANAVEGTSMEWEMGLMTANPFGVGRIYGITDAAVVS